MARFVTGNEFTTGDQVTATTLNNAVNNAKVSTDSVDNSSVAVDGSGVLSVKTSTSTSDGVTDIIKTLPGVSSSNEMSSQYSVRGGNFDENNVFVNDIEIYRPFLISTGQQEGLPFVNSALVSSILFSAGGFGAEYGDKMSSVLDIKYKRPNEFGGSFAVSLLGADLSFGGTAAKNKFTYLVGGRYQTNQYILNS